MAEPELAPAFITINPESPDAESQLHDFEIAMLERPDEHAGAITLIRVLGTEAVGKVLELVDKSPEHLEALNLAYQIFSTGLDKAVVSFDPDTEASIDANPKIQSLVANQQMDPELRSRTIRHRRFEEFAKRVAAWKAKAEQQNPSLEQTA